MTGSETFRVGIDLGGTKTEAVLLSPEGEVLFRERRPTPLAEGYDRVVASVASLAADAAGQAPSGSDRTVGIGIPGSVDAHTGLVRNANSTCLIGRPFPADLERALGTPVAVRNDADCFTMAECAFGSGRGYGLVFGVIMGTGCGGGICIDGVVREGPHRIAGEWGHMPVDPGGAPCYCGLRGCVETKISGSGVERSFLRGYGEHLSMKEIVAGARQGDERCRTAFDRFLDDFGRCLAMVVCLLDPDAVVLGGGLSGIAEIYTEGLRRLRHYAFHDDLRTPVLRNRLGDSAGVFGAAWLGASSVPDFGSAVDFLPPRGSRS